MVISDDPFIQLLYIYTTEYEKGAQWLDAHSPDKDFIEKLEYKFTVDGIDYTFDELLKTFLGGKK